MHDSSETPTAARSTHISVETGLSAVWGSCFPMEHVLDPSTAVQKSLVPSATKTMARADVAQLV